VLRHLPYFVAVAEEEHFQRAAARLRVAQSALSRRMQDLEQELGGVTLFARQSRGVRLTESGRAFLQDARRLLADLEQAQARAAAIMKGDLGELHIGFTEVAAHEPALVAAIQKFRHHFPEVRLRLTPMVSVGQQQAIAAGKLDAGLLYHAPDFNFAARSPDSAPALAHALIGKDRMVLAVPHSHPLSGRRRVWLRDLAGEEIMWASRQENRELYDRMMEACHSQGFSPNVGIEATSSATTFSLLSMGVGVGFVPASCKIRAPANVTLRAVEDFFVPLDISLVWRADDCPVTLANFRALIDEVVAAGILDLTGVDPI
jgi:DNA-binding transcriptional LysR family regulator